MKVRVETRYAGKFWQVKGIILYYFKIIKIGLKYLLILLAVYETNAVLFLIVVTILLSLINKKSHSVGINSYYFTFE